LIADIQLLNLYFSDFYCCCGFFILILKVFYGIMIYIFSKREFTTMLIFYFLQI